MPTLRRIAFALLSIGPSIFVASCGDGGAAASPPAAESASALRGLCDPADWDLEDAPFRPRPTGLAGQTVRAEEPGAIATVLVFLDTECPVANAMAPELERLRARFAPEGIAFRHVYPDRTLTVEAIREHARDYALDAVAVRDPGHVWVERFGATISPEAAVIVDGDVVYRGRVDDRAVALGVRRPGPGRRDLELALESILAGRAPDPARTPAVGCRLADLPAQGARD
ncbi:hypothetical protein [Engelhardtia mirabilis]|uniref:Uncharacterized protein n=1 Tax=Engelhardtia mirabilis TaxID=2528011 RepID=A0A518BHK1_9BACT|nr:hypothetical protein Pla133_15070 [Planctomycetes bacterium Pla133]QDV00760.1 hypothetical protein Pla86_15060 [Planctomycetes bacterium Pla86]